jgi:hypothetical protein
VTGRLQLLFKKRTGIHVDEYNDTKFSSGLNPFMHAMKDCVPKDEPSLTAREMILLIDVLEDVARNKTPVIFVDD